MENESQRQRSLICRGIVEVIVVDKHVSDSSFAKFGKLREKLTSFSFV